MPPLARPRWENKTAHRQICHRATLALKEFPFQGNSLSGWQLCTTAYGPIDLVNMKRQNKSIVQP